jgi:hypothetical protein
MNITKNRITFHFWWVVETMLHKQGNAGVETVGLFSGACRGL